ncbi:MAG: hypothetical protein AAF919_10500 [Pseudomonadota bacterium]
MAKHVIETVTFTLNEGVRREDFAAAADQFNAWIRARPGFIARRLSCSADGTWIEHIEWASMADAKQAAAQIGQAEGGAPFLSAIDGVSAKMTHSELEVAVN